MGHLYYGAAATKVRVEDHVLQHLKVVVVTKLRRSEPFLLSWDGSVDVGHGRSSVWIHPDCDLHFAFEGSKPAELDHALLETMVQEASTAAGLRVSAVTVSVS